MLADEFVAESDLLTESRLRQSLRFAPFSQFLAVTQFSGGAFRCPKIILQISVDPPIHSVESKTMLTRQRRKANQKAALTAAKEILRARGWTYRAAGPVLKVRFEHLSRVLNGQRQSARLLQRIEDIPPAAADVKGAA